MFYMDLLQYRMKQATTVSGHVHTAAKRVLIQIVAPTVVWSVNFNVRKEKEVEIKSNQ